MPDNTIATSNGDIVRYNPEGDWSVLSLHEVYLQAGQSGGKPKIVAKVGDWVVHPENGNISVCTALDPATLIPTLQSLRGSDSSLTDSDTNLPNTYRVYFDESTVPYTLNVDSRFFVGGSTTKYAKIFRGTDTGPTGTVIAFMQDNVGNEVTSNIPLEDAARQNVTGILQKTVKSAKTKTLLKNGEIVTVVIYDDHGKFFASDAFKVVNTSWVAGTHSDTKYVTHVSLVSPFISPTNNRLLEYPINIQLNALNLFGVVHYSDGSQSDPQPIDGTKFRLFGLEQFVGVYPTQRAGLTLSYRLDANEAAYGAVSADGKFINAAYELVTTEQQNAFTVRLSAYPVWNSQAQEYRLKWYMTDLARDTLLDVTPFVYFNASSHVWNGKLYGQLQALSVRINLKDVSAAYPSYIHTQMQWIALNGPATEEGPRWKIAFNQNQEPLFGETLHATAVMINQNLWRVNVRFGATTFDEWISKVYYDAKPLYDIRTEKKPPLPTHMRIFSGNARTEVPIENWDKEFQVAVGFADQSNIEIEFLKKDEVQTLRLGVINMPIKRL